MVNFYIGSEGIPIEQDDDGAFRVTQEKSDISEEFKEIVKGDNE